MCDSPDRELRKGLRSMGVCGEENLVSRLAQYLKLLEKWNQKINLVGSTDIGSMVGRHVLDSLTIDPYLSGKTVVDAGSGAGLPGIPLAILNTDKEFILVDSSGKKTRFLFQVKTELGLPNVTVENCRVEHYESSRQIDMVISRAFSSLEELVVKTRHLFSSRRNKSCKLLAMKGRYPEEEITALPNDVLISRIEKLKVPGENSQRHVVELMCKEGHARD